MTKGHWVVETAIIDKAFDTYEEAKEFHNECLQECILALPPVYEEYDDGEGEPINFPDNDWYEDIG